ncbi:MAG TPA: DNA-3-methyladenine glycosylase [Candidatus Saccharimonadales bacterium]|nr:DNA-3-methyladenine glycosylase [Candidatus Saccharimonadales bacterium]
MTREEGTPPRGELDSSTVRGASSGRTPGILRLSSLEAAPQLLGWKLCRQLPGGTVKLKIVETEAYHQEDPASHSYRGNTPRTWPMFESGGHIYVYFTYGMHYALNLVTGRKGTGEAILIRAAEPLEGLEIMQVNRSVSDPRHIASGPGKLAQALGISDTALSGKTLGKSTIWLEPPDELIKTKDIVSAPRVGIKQAIDLPWRFYIRGNSFVSKL